MPEPEVESIASQVFGIPELFLLVLSYLAPTGNATISSIDTPTLASLARVSRNISNAALDALWRSMYRPDAIARLLPDDAYYVDGKQNDEYKLRRPLTAEDFVVFDKYAYRVHYVDFSNSSAKLQRGSELFPYFKDFRYPLLPSLKDFRWEPSVYNGSIGALYLISPDGPVPSREFTLLMWSEIDKSPNESEAIRQTIDAFNDPALPWLPDVERMHLRTLEFLPAARDAVQRLANLERFSFDLSADPRLFRRLAALPRLKSLDTRNLPYEAMSLVPPESTSFPVLESLRISGDIRALSACLPLVSSPHLNTVRLIPRRDTPSVSPSLFESLVPEHIPARTTTLTHFAFTSPLGRGTVALRLVIASFAPLHACHNLETFRVDADSGELLLTDTDIHAMAAAWPHLVDILISPPRLVSHSSSAVTLYSLWAFAIGCPGLLHLAIEVDADVSEAFNVPNDEIQPNANRPRMKDFVLFCSPCGDPVVVIAFIKQAFPNVDARAFQAYGTVQRPEDKARWGRVTAALDPGLDSLL
ncbi:hypothetical protein C8F01DRAFT_1101621 [Mycena amicta]|nr:hypothetical protein C8F01DRAFT_1101621 [Mycena amicta]